MALPAWLSQVAGKTGTFSIDPDAAYPAILTALGVAEADIDQYWIETAYQCAKLGAEDHVVFAGLDPRPAAPLVLLVQPADAAAKERWALASRPAGRGAEAATRGREARGHYERIRGKF